MVKTRLVRLPEPVYQKYFAVKLKMESDIKTPISMPKVFNAVIDPKMNNNYIEVDLDNLKRVARRRNWL